MRPISWPSGMRLNIITVRDLLRQARDKEDPALCAVRELVRLLVVQPLRCRAPGHEAEDLRLEVRTFAGDTTDGWF